jgi:hypothetical protein
MPLDAAGYSARPLFDLLRPDLAPSWRPLGAAFPSAHEAWLWACTASAASLRGDTLEGPCSPETILEAAETLSLTRFEWFLMTRVGLDGMEPEDAIEAAVYKSAMGKLQKRLAAIPLPPLG